MGWDLDRQQDSSEFIQTLLGSIDEFSINAPTSIFGQRPADTLEREMINFVREQLHITTKNKITCIGAKDDEKQKGCGDWWYGGGNNTETKHNMLFLPFPDNDYKNQSIQKLLEHYTTASPVGPEHKCERCYKKGFTEKKIVFTTAPKYLLIGIKRMIFDGVDDPKKIIENVALNKFIIIKVNERATKYELLSTLNHKGRNMNVGHYTNTKTVNNQLYICDDATIKPTTHFNAKQAYCLLYKKVDAPICAPITFHQNRKNRKRKAKAANIPLNNQPPNRKQKLNDTTISSK